MLHFNSEFLSCSRALANACDSVCCASGTSLSAPRIDTLLAMVAGSVPRITLRQRCVHMILKRECCRGPRTSAATRYSSSALATAYSNALKRVSRAETHQACLHCDVRISTS